MLNFISSCLPLNTTLFRVLGPRVWVKLHYSPNFEGTFLNTSKIVKKNTQVYLGPCHTSMMDRSSHPEVFLRKGVLKICSKYTGEHSCRSTISIKLQRNFIEIWLRHGCSHVNLLHNFHNTFSYEHIWTAAFAWSFFEKIFNCSKPIILIYF